MHGRFPILPLLFTAVVSAQIGGQYPPGTYPPGGGYPPGSYPDTYPSNRYPARIPGGPTVGIPIPDIKLPKIGGKDKEKEKPKPAQQTEPAVQTRTAPAPDSVRAVQGTVRQLTERELLLQVEKLGILRFRVLAKTRFQDDKGEPMRDSLIKPGDLIAAHFNPIDEETILVVRFVRAGTADERAAASKTSRSRQCEGS